jgi:hypothetical protein
VNVYFPKLKNIKTKLRSLISQDIMKAVLMTNIERDYIVDKEIVVNSIAKCATKLSRILICDVIHMYCLICLTFYIFNIN